MHHRLLREVRFSFDWIVVYPLDRYSFAGRVAVPLTKDSHLFHLPLPVAANSEMLSILKRTLPLPVSVARALSHLAR